MKETFDYKLRLNKANKEMLEIINSILEGYRAQNYVLTLRQLYYQLVSKNIIPNNDKEYGKLSNILKKGRMAGIVDWDAIEDRVRRPQLPWWCYDIQGAQQTIINQYRLDRMSTQSDRIEVWVEKDALSNVLYRITSKYHVRLMVNRGYSSVSAMYEAYKRLNSGDTILYFGDHDPSGLDMIRDVKDRMADFGLDINVVPIALTKNQVDQYDCPPNPAKITDSRSGWYIEQFGQYSWELDALPIDALAKLCEDAILDRINFDLWQEQVDLEKKHIAEIRAKFNM